MAKIIEKRMTARIKGDFVVFIIGLRINKLWKFHKWMPVALAMPKMINELSKNPESGFLGFQNFGGIPPVMIQYWKSFEHLAAYAKDKEGNHFPAWREFNKKIKQSDVGIWHETYIIKDGMYENIYNNMPPYAMGKLGNLIPAEGTMSSAYGRMKT